MGLSLADGFKIVMAIIATALAMGGAAAQLVAGPKTNPFLSAPIYGIVHFDPAQTDTIPFAVKRGTFAVDPTRLDRVAGGPVNIMNLAATDPDFMWAVGTDRIAYVSVANGGWRAVAEFALPGVQRLSRDALDALIAAAPGGVAELERRVPAIAGANPVERLTNGLYSLADRDNTVFVNVGSVIHGIGLVDERDPAKGIRIRRSLDMGKVFQPLSVPGAAPAVRLIGFGMTYDGHLVVGSLNGIAVVDRMFAKPPIVHVIAPGQFVSNSFSIDENNGIYLASGSLQARGDGVLNKLVWTGSRISSDAADGAWQSPYDGGDWPPAIKAGTGTGSTPTLMGFGDDEDRFVVLTDGTNRMNIVAFWRDRIPADFVQKPGTKSRRIADQMPITAGLPANTAWVQSEQSVVVNGFGAFVVNNVVTNGHSDKLIDVIALGPHIAPPKGMERVAWNVAKRAWSSVWTRNDVASTSMVPVASSGSNMVFVNGFSARDGWEVTGMDWMTGATVHRTIFGASNLGNGAYALIQFNARGDMLFNSIAGPMLAPLSSRRAIGAPETPAR